MTSQGFGKNSGPGGDAAAAPPPAIGVGLPKPQTPFGFFPPSQTPLPSASIQPSLSVQKRTNSPFPVYQNHRPGQGFGPSGESERHVSPSSLWGNQSSISSKASYPPAQQGLTFVSPYLRDDSGKGLTSKHADVQIPKRTRSPSLPLTSEVSKGDSVSAKNGSRRASVSPPKLNTRPNSRTDPRSHAWSPPSANADKSDLSETNASDFPVPKRSRLPLSSSTEPLFQRNNSSGYDDSERELQAKAKRWARFKDELSQPEPSDTGNRNRNPQQLDQFVVHTRKAEASDVAGGLGKSNLSFDNEGHDSSTAIIGFCPEMCPEQERAERERKGDLDQYERLDGDRNQTSVSLAVKKYTRTAEREAALIRPMPILQKTMDYLLNLLNQPYDDRLLGVYNFLWDRMRAIRMDLRMQHIFNLDAIIMLEQMIRLHIIAMHELCQYTKGEGFSEGFDAHLNIEQMNKTSVELFQLYDDHRKKGIDVPTEKEFRGYYALLKLDKHPGYKVEPAELSLDLAKMTPEIRKSAEVLFARDVARACRTGNFITFFRLARKASYLQACLMHSHFGKLRSQALASLHSGLQNNQGIPVTQVAKWLGMEEENIEDLLEYHGLFIKEFEEPYMVKEGPFLNGESEYPLKCSKLVHMKRSNTVVEDVSSSSLMELSPRYDRKELLVNKAYVEEESPVICKETQSHAKVIDKSMSDHEAFSASKADIQMQPIFSSVVADRWSEDQHRMEAVSSSQADILISSFGSPKVSFSSVGKPSSDTQFKNSLEKNGQSNLYVMPPQVTPRVNLVATSPDLEMYSPVQDSMVQPVSVEDLELEEPTNVLEEEESDRVDTNCIDEEVAEAKLKLILRKWRRRSLKKKDLRDQKQLAANAALRSLSLGPPVRYYKEQLPTPGEFDIDLAMCRRYEKQEQSWSKLDVSSLLAAILGERNQYPKCICWKMILCSLDNPDGGMLDPRPWLRSKLMPADIGNNDGLVISLPGLSIWKKWVHGKPNDLTCCLSVVKEIQFDNLVETAIAGASAVVYLLSEGIPLEAQKTQLQKFLSSIPSGSHLPLLVLSGSYENDSDTLSVVKSLGLDEVDKSRICTFSVVSLVKSEQIKSVVGFFSDEQLRKGLEWLASHSPLQPAVHSVKTRELVLTHVNDVFHVLEQFDAYKVGPEHCISAINEALDQSIEEIGKAAMADSIGWPCPEISLLSKSTEEHRITELYLPSIGWSSGARIEPLIHALDDCKVPTIPKILSWREGSNMGIDIENQRLELEDYLVKYLTQLMGLHLARKEASILLQNCARLELHGSSYYIIPNWIMMFRRVFNWQLMNIASGEFAAAYILDDEQRQDNASIITSRVMGKLGSEGAVHETYNLISPSLDEMVEVCCSSQWDQKELQPRLPVVSQPLEVKLHSDDHDSLQEERKFGQNVIGAEAHGGDVIDRPTSTGGLLAVESNATKETDRLSKLLEQCNIVQNMIDEKLSLYF